MTSASGSSLLARAPHLGSIEQRVNQINWTRVSQELDDQGYALIEHLLAADECRRIRNLYDQPKCFRSTVVMARHAFGRGEYKYFNYPLPELVANLRTSVYPLLVPIANRWYQQLRIAAQFPATHSEYLKRCHKAGQLRPTPLLLQYSAGDYNCLHQDLYGEHVFPLQLAILLSEPVTDFTGGEFVLTDQRPRMQSRPMVVPLRKGDAVVFAVQSRPVQGKRGIFRVNLRHGVSKLHSGHRQCLGIIFHDAQ